MKPKKREMMIWLNHLAEIDYQTIKKIEDYLGDLELLWAVDEKHIMKALENRSIIAEKIIHNRREDDFKKMLQNLYKRGWKVYTLADEDYPDKLREIYDPPPVIYGKGIVDFSRPLIAMVGARKATVYGKWAGNQFAKELAQAGVGVISGLALGIDTACHQGAIENQGYTIGVLGCGLDQCYPASNTRLAEQLVQNGCLISEYCPGTPPLKHHFPARNRMISGLSDGVAILEAAEKSGALITIDFALQHGKEVYSLPGNVNQLQSKGTNLLIREGAKPLLSVQDILEDLEQMYPQLTELAPAVENQLSELEARIFYLIKREPSHIDKIAYEGKLTIQALNGILTALELKGFISQLPGKTFTANR